MEPNLVKKNENVFRMVNGFHYLERTPLISAYISIIPVTMKL